MAGFNTVSYRYPQWIIFLCFTAYWYKIMETRLNKITYSGDIWYKLLFPVFHFIQIWGGSSTECILISSDVHTLRFYKHGPRNSEFGFAWIIAITTLGKILISCASFPAMHLWSKHCFIKVYNNDLLKLQRKKIMIWRRLRRASAHSFLSLLIASEENSNNPKFWVQVSAR